MLHYLRRVSVKADAVIEGDRRPRSAALSNKRNRTRRIGPEQTLEHVRNSSAPAAIR